MSLAYKVRYTMTLNARAAMQMLELRTERQGHPSYRKVCQDMHTLIADKAGHHAVAEMMTLRRPRDVRPRAPRVRTPRRASADADRVSQSG